MNLRSMFAAAALTPALLALPAAMPAAVAASHHPAAAARHNHCNYPPSHTSLTISVSRSQVRAGHRVVAFGALFNDRCTIKHARVHLYSYGNLIGTVRTDYTGDYRFVLHPEHKLRLQTTFNGNRYAAAAVSRRVTVTVTHH